MLKKSYNKTERSFLDFVEKCKKTLLFMILKTSPNFFKFIVLSVFAILLIVVLGSAIIYFIHRIGQENQKPAVSQNMEKQQVRHIYIGYIEKIEPNKITLKATKQNNGLPNDIILTAAVDEKTEILKVTVPKKIIAEAQTGEKIFQQEKITFNDLKIGDQVSVINNSLNLAGLKEFKAEKIILNTVK